GAWRRLLQRAANDAEGRPGRAERAAQLVRDEAQVAGALLADLLVAALDVRADCAGGPGVQAGEEDAGLARRDGAPVVVDDLEDGVAEQTVLADHLVEVEPGPPALATVLGGRFALLGKRALGRRVERGHQLGDERRHLVGQLGTAQVVGAAPFAKSAPPPCDDGVPLLAQKFLQTTDRRHGPRRSGSGEWPTCRAPVQRPRKPRCPGHVTPGPRVLILRRFGRLCRGSLASHGAGEGSWRTRARGAVCARHPEPEPLHP